MSDTRNHTTRDQLAEALEAHTVEDYSEGELYGDDASLLCACGFVAYGSDLYDAGHNHRAHITDALLASDAIAAVRAAAVAETTAAIEATLDGLSGKRDLFWQRYLNAETGHSEALNQGRFEGYAEAQSIVRAALSGGRTALDDLLAQAQRELLLNLAREAEERGDIGKQPGGMEAWDWLRGVVRRYGLDKCDAAPTDSRTCQLTAGETCACRADTGADQ